MKTFKKGMMLLLTISSLLMFSVTAYAKEDSDSGETQETFALIYGMDATVRDCTELNIRQKPSTSSKVLATIPVGEHLTIIDQVGKWFEVEYKDINGFVFWKYISFTEEEILEDSDLIGNSIIHYTSNDNRDTNISIACETINGLVLNPGEEFRWSDVVGQATAKKGYLKAPVIVNKKSVLGFGGGVCQVSTTIYNAVLDTSLEVLEVHKHSIGSAYAKNDATVAYGSKDFAFENTYDFPIEIECYSYKAVVFVNLYRVETE